MDKVCSVNIHNCRKREELKTWVDDIPQHIGWLDQLLQDVGLGGQGEAIVQHLVQNLFWADITLHLGLQSSKTDLIDNNIVVLDDGLRALGEVILYGVDDAVQELDDKERGNLSHAHCHKEYVRPGNGLFSACLLSVDSILNKPVYRDQIMMRSGYDWGDVDGVCCLVLQKGKLASKRVFIRRVKELPAHQRSSRRSISIWPTSNAFPETHLPNCSLWTDCGSCLLKINIHMSLMFILYQFLFACCLLCVCGIFLYKIWYVFQMIVY